MPDSPDYSKYLIGSVRFSLQDMGELAARLGSLSTFDRRGEVAFMETFMGGLGAWQTNASGTGGSVSLVANPTYRNPFAVKLITGSTASKNAQISKSIGVAELTSIGVEIFIAPTTLYDTIMLRLSAQFNSIEYTGELQIKNTPAIFQVVNSLSVSETVGAHGTLETTDGNYTPFKLVIDLSTAKYKRVIAAGQEIDVSTIAIQQSAGSDTNLIMATIRLTAESAANRVGYVAQCIITANEP